MRVVSQENMDSLSRPLFKNKPISKQSPRNYSEFYKFKYMELKSMHPSWSMGQLSTIINLSWKREKANRRRSLKKDRVHGRTAPTGYQALRMSRNLSSQEAKAIWRRLPMETKMSWSMRSA